MLLIFFGETHIQRKDEELRPINKNIEGL